MRRLLPVIIFVLSLLNFINPRMDLILNSFEVIVAHQTEQRVLIRYLESCFRRLDNLPVKRQIILVMRGSGGRFAHPGVFLNFGRVLAHHLRTVVDFVLLLVVGRVAGFKMLCGHDICTVVSIERLQSCLICQND